MKILGIDPGPEESALVWWTGSAVDDSLMVPSKQVRTYIAELPIDNCQIACEHLQCFGMAVGKETFETAYWIGEYRAIAALLDMPFHRIYRSDVKMTLCGNMRAKDANIRQALLDRFGGKAAAIGKKKTPGPLYGVSGHLWSALAVAITLQDLQPGVVTDGPNAGKPKYTEMQ